MTRTLPTFGWIIGLLVAMGATGVLAQEVRDDWRDDRLETKRDWFERNEDRRSSVGPVRADDAFGDDGVRDGSYREDAYRGDSLRDEDDLIAEHDFERDMARDQISSRFPDDDAADDVNAEPPAQRRQQANILTERTLRPLNARRDADGLGTDPMRRDRDTERDVTTEPGQAARAPEAVLTPKADRIPQAERKDAGRDLPLPGAQERRKTEDNDKLRKARQKDRARLAALDRQRREADRIELERKRAEQNKLVMAETATAVLRHAERLISDDQTNKTDQAYFKAIRAFYEMRQGEPLWLGMNGLNSAGLEAVKVLQEAGTWGLDNADYVIAPSAFQDLQSADMKADAELGLTKKVLKYANDAKSGRVKPADLSNDIYREPPQTDLSSVLTDLLITEDVRAYLEARHPAHQQFRLLRTELQQLLRPEAADSGEDLSARQRRRVARRRAARAERLALNLEMWRWMPENLGTLHVLANIPEFAVRVIDNDRVVFRERVIVGKQKTQTTIFSDEMDHVIFRPRWGVPSSIKVNKFLPGLLRGGDPISAKGYVMQIGSKRVNPRTIDWSRNDIRRYSVIQPSGPRNALGRVKFMFPNKHAIYMHDTPSKHLFKSRQRLYSHGCVRVRNPDAFAKVLLRYGNGWSERRVENRMARGPDSDRVTLDRKLPVHVAYFTAWADPETGDVSYFKDVYRHERHLKFALAGQYDRIVKIERNTNTDIERIRASYTPTTQREPESWFGFGGGYATSDRRTSTSTRSDWARRAFQSE